MYLNPSIWNCAFTKSPLINPWKQENNEKKKTKTKSMQLKNPNESAQKSRRTQNNSF